MVELYNTVRPGVIWVLAIVMAGLVTGKIISTSASLKEVISQNRLGILLSWEILKIVTLIWVLASIKSLFPLAEAFFFFIMDALASAGRI